MSFDVQSLAPAIREILAAPGTDLETISAKRVRKQLLETIPDLTAEIVKENKDDIDELIATVFREVKDDGGDDAEPRGEKRGHDAEDDADEGEEEEATPPPKAKKARKSDLSDAQLARKLSEEINGRQRSARASSAKGGRGRGGKRGGKSGKKSAATVDEDGEAEGSGEEDKPKKKRGGGFQKEYKLSEPLAAVVNAEQLSRPQVVKHLWEYIKANNLQNPENKKEIVCDDSLRAMFNVDKIDMFKMNKVLGSHLYAIQ